MSNRATSTSGRAEERTPLRILFLCTGNSARSQIAEAILNVRGQGRFHAESAGSDPAPRVNPFALDALREFGLEWGGRNPRRVEEVCDEAWDFIITVCDRARESCGTFPGRPVTAHWGIPDPAAVEGDDRHRRGAFRESVILLARRVDLFLSLPIETLERRAWEERVRAIGASEATRQDQPSFSEDTR
jgi:arsenate reductase (thioredoxin)